MEKIKVLLLAGKMNVGGIENQLMHLLRQADKSKFQIDFTTTAKHPYFQDEMEALGARCIHIQGTEGIHFLRYCREIYSIMKTRQYDIVHSHELFHSGMVLFTACIAGVKHRFVHAHNWSDDEGDGKKRSIKRTIYNSVMQWLIVHSATEFIACSSLAGKFLYGEKVTRWPNYHVVFNSVDTTKFIEKYNQKEYGEFCNDGWINVLQVGRFTAVKNQLFSLEILKCLKDRGERIRLLFVGNTGDDYEVAVRTKIDEYHLEDYAILLGVRSDVDVLMRKSSAFLLPSLYEGMPLVLIEAQASGLSCVTADTYSHEVDFGIGIVKWMSLKQPAAEWADAVEEAIARGRAKRADVVNAVEKYGFDSRVFAEKICSLYEQAVKG